MSQIKYIIFICIFFVTPLSAQIFKWVDENGVTHYSDSQPEKIKVEEFTIDSYDAVSIESLPESYQFEPIERDPKLTRKSSKRVVMYSTQRCGYCKKARKYFKKQNIRFVEYDIDRSKSARARYNKLGAKGVPVILVGKKRMNGFNVAGFNRIYN